MNKTLKIIICAVTLFKLCNCDFSANCSAAIDRLKQGPANWQSIISTNTIYTDADFSGINSIYWNGLYTDSLSQTSNINSYFSSQPNTTNNIAFKRVNAIDSNHILMNSTPTWSDVRSTGNLNNSYFMASLASVSVNFDIISQIFYSNLNNQGVYAVLLYIRGLPWIVTVDDQILTQYDGTYQQYIPMFSRQDYNTHSVWPMILEKAWAKV